MQKENPNPVVHTTHKRSHPSCSSASPLIGSSAIRRYHLGSSPSADTSPDDGLSLGWSSITAEDRSVALALSAAAYPSPAHPSANTSTPSSSTDDSTSPKLDILQQAGFALFHPQRIQKQCRAIRYPSYAPSTHTKKTFEVAPVQTSIQHELKRDAITANEVFDIIRNIQDPEHPLTLEQLNVVRLDSVEVVDLKGENADGDLSIQMNGCTPRRFSTVHVKFTPTIPHCSMATLIGLSLRVKLLRSLPSRFKVVVEIESGTHVSEHAVNKQLSDKERVRAALENEHLLGVVNRCIAGGMQMQ
ncbi:hypothetical protein ACHAXR_001377 [Thalassiosira sp. AJA248-18]